MKNMIELISVYQDLNELVDKDYFIQIPTAKNISRLIQIAKLVHPDKYIETLRDFYQAILDSQVFPFIKEKNPDLIIVSFGFDAHQYDL